MPSHHVRVAYRFLPLATAICLALSGTAFAETSSNGVTQLPDITVKAGQQRKDLKPDSPTNPYRMPESAKASTQVITAEEIEKMQAKDVFEVLNHATGTFETTSSRKGFSSLSIRGDSKFVWIIDGAYMHPTMASRMMRSIPPQSIEEIQVVRGSTALTMGPLVGFVSPSGAPTDGFVILRTRQPKEEKEVKLRAAVETQDGNAVSAWGGKRFDTDDKKAYVTGLVSHYETNGPNDPLINGNKPFRARQSNSAMAKTGIEKNGWNANLTAFHDEGEFQIPNTNFEAERNWYMNPSKTDVIVGTASKQWNKTHTTIASASNSQTKQTFYTGVTPVQNDNKLTHFNVRHSIDLDKTRIQVGGDHLHWRSPTGQNYYEGIEREEKITSMFAQAEHKLFDERLVIDGGIRRDRVEVIKGLDYFTAGRQPPRPTPRVSNRTLPTAKFESLGASYVLNDKVKLSARLGQSEQDDSNLNPVPGVTLKPEKQNKWELGVEGTVSPKFTPTLTVFERQTENEKALLGYSYTRNNGTTATCFAGTIPASGATAPNAAGLQPCYTQSDTTKQGVELAIKGDFAERSNYKVGITHMTKLTNTAGTLGQTTPKDVIDLSVNHGMGLYTVGASAKRVSSYTSSSRTIGGYNRYDLSLSRDFRMNAKPVKATLYGKNVTDKKYETTAGVEDVGAVYGVEFLMDF